MRGLFVASRLILLWLGDWWLRLRGRRTRLRRMQRFERTLQHLGMVWIRVVQTLSLRGSLLSTPVGFAIQDLRDLGGARPWPQMKEILEAELGRPVTDVFEEIETHPFVATTVSQTHRARLKEEEEWVAVKIQQPYAKDIFEHDLRLISRVFSVLKMLDIMPGMRWDDLFHELREIQIRELNYHYEAASLRRLSQNLVMEPVHVPQVYDAYSSGRVLVMEFIQGALLSDFIYLSRTDPRRLQLWLRENNIDPKLLAQRLFRSVYRQVFEDNFFHGDLHTANIILLRDSRIGVIECRSAGSLDRESLAKQRHFLDHLARGELDTAAEIYFLLATQLPRVDLNIVKQKLIRVWRTWETRVHVTELPYLEKSLSYTIGRMNRVLYGSQFAAQWAFSKLTGAWVHLDLALANLDPAFNYQRGILNYMEMGERRHVTTNIGNLPGRVGAALVALHEFPRKMEEYNLLRESLMRRQAQVVQGSASKLDAVIAALFGLGSMVFLTIFVFLASIFCMRFYDFNLDVLLGPQLVELSTVVPRFGQPAWLVVLLIVLGLQRFTQRLRKRFSTREYGSHSDAAPSLD
ncbi:MAG: AarF/ABC1/UbiB kinase family protein [Acidobacteriota bacterium]|nr:AarF/ABC1/UbiB kinase family protein [Acidobacteriota bacterium]